ncbi:MAG TPA: sulfotransferase domain-containing protein [Oscillatoriaceae cyanobacterium M33_DOE_052]|uniref:Sulfotransferase domain-containing protein n=1 Tax=Planktothricoides sp. SpSt-374 TaxID=2282167 RepID=A0A7C3VE45_9CYAN|nr:sulfotransferase domain-containing protein [Oscillatoriaceae cyanobacterium M33_DOE_052]
MKIMPSKIETALRYLMVYSLSDILPLYIVNEHPKSGGTWVGQMLGQALDLPFPRNQLPLLRPSIMHGHYLNPWTMKNVVVVWRDGRDVMVSWYHHSLFEHTSGRNLAHVKACRQRLNFQNYEDIQKNLPKFIEYCFTQRQESLRFSWVDFVRQWHQHPEAVCVRYEDLRKQPLLELNRIVKELTGQIVSETKLQEIVDNFSFEKQSGRVPGQEQKNNFLRKGIVGDWQNNFSKEACEVFDRYAGDELIMLGYESDRSWIH